MAEMVEEMVEVTAAEVAVAIDSVVTTHDADISFECAGKRPGDVKENSRKLLPNS